MAVGNYMEAVLDKLVDSYTADKLAERQNKMLEPFRSSTVEDRHIEDRLLDLAAMWVQLKQNRKREQESREEEARRKQLSVDTALCQQVAYVKSRLPEALLEFDSGTSVTTLIVRHRTETANLCFVKSKDQMTASFPADHTMPGFQMEDLSGWQVSESPTQSSLIQEFRTVIAVMAEKE